MLAFAVVMFASTALGAATAGLYFDYWPGVMSYSPGPWSFFDIYLYLHNAPYYITAIEYRIETPTDPGHANFILYEVKLGPQAVVDLGAPFEGHTIAFWPPLSGYDTGYNLICGYRCLTTLPCLPMGAPPEPGAIADYPLVVGPHPDSGELRGAYFPDNLLFPITGFRSILCPNAIGTEETSWGVIKSLFR